VERDLTRANLVERGFTATIDDQAAGVFVIEPYK